jgi:hypothetical protein
VRGVWESRRWGGEMTQTMYAHMNKWINKPKKEKEMKDLHNYTAWKKDIKKDIRIIELILWKWLHMIYRFNIIPLKSQWHSSQT